MVLPETYRVGPAYARAYYLDNDNNMRCLLPCSTELFAHFTPHAAAPLSLTRWKAKITTKVTCAAGTPLEWFDSLPEAVARD